MSMLVRWDNDLKTECLVHHMTKLPDTPHD